MTSRITGTFNALVKLADFSESALPGAEGQDTTAVDEEEGVQRETSSTAKGGRTLRPEFHYNIQIHLPSNATEEVYLNIFNALRKTFQ